jgi:spermidine synthase
MRQDRIGYEIDIKQFKTLLDELERKEWESERDKAETVFIVTQFINEHSLLRQVLRIDGGGGGVVGEVVKIIDKLVPPKSHQEGRKNKDLNQRNKREIKSLFQDIFNENKTKKSTAFDEPCDTMTYDTPYHMTLSVTPKRSKPESPRNIFSLDFEEGKTTRKKSKRKTLDQELEEIDQMWDDFDDRMELL